MTAFVPRSLHKNHVRTGLSFRSGGLVGCVHANAYACGRALTPVLCRLRRKVPAMTMLWRWVAFPSSQDGACKIAPCSRRTFRGVALGRLNSLFELAHSQQSLRSRPPAYCSILYASLVALCLVSSLWCCQSGALFAELRSDRRSTNYTAMMDAYSS